jgi:hypothetical protein
MESNKKHLIGASRWLIIISSRVTFNCFTNNPVVVKTRFVRVTVSHFRLSLNTVRVTGRHVDILVRFRKYRSRGTKPPGNAYLFPS